MEFPRTHAKRFERPGDRDDAITQVGDVLAAKRQRLGTALHELATELATERRRSAQLARENRRLRDLLDRLS